MDTFDRAGAIYDIPRMPEAFQGNGETINPRLRRCIFDGEPCEINDDVRAALKKYTAHNSMVNIAAIVILLMLILKVVVYFLRSDRDIPAGLVVIMGVVAIIIAVFAYRQYANGAALRAADRGEAKCFRYNCRGKCRYVIDTQDDSCMYFADMGDFMVHITHGMPAAPYAYGLVVNIKGSEYFYLLV